MRRLPVKDTAHPAISFEVPLQEFSEHRSKRDVKMRGVGYRMELLHCDIQPTFHVTPRSH
jgi:hypothetical protein